MKSELKWRLAVVGGVFLIAILLVFPTFHYFLAVSGRVSADAEQLEVLRARSVPLGLDLQGGVDVLLEVDREKTEGAKVENFAEDIRTSFRRESPSIDATVEVTTDTKGISVTVARPEQVRSADNILSAMNWLFPTYRAGSLEAGQPMDLTVNREVLDRDMAETIATVDKVIRERVDSLGVTQPSVALQGANRIRVQIPGEKDPEHVIKTVIRPAQLEFRGIKVGEMPDADNRLNDDSASYIDPATGKALEGRTIPPGYEPRLYREASRNRATNETLTEERYILVRSRVELTGDALEDAWVTINPTPLSGSGVEIHIEFTPEGTKKFADVTEAFSTGSKKPLAIILDGIVYSFPHVQGRIDQGQAVITGGFSQQDGADLSRILKAGALPAELRPAEQRTVEATLGADSIKKSLLALTLGSAVVAGMMIVYYGAAGIIAVAATLLNVLLIFAFMKLANATLTLSGIGGILLTVGMAVDGNILIYERIREELHNGKQLRTAIQQGFNRALSVILDANLTTLIAGLTLLQFGEGSVRGFALALNVGILATLFTGLFVTHALLDAWYAKFGKLSLGKFSWFRPGFFLDFIRLRPFSYVISGGLMIASIITILPLSGLPNINWGVEFSGGVLTEVATTRSVTTQELQADYGDWRVQKVAGENRYLIRAKLVDESDNQIPATQAVVAERLTTILGQDQYTVLGSDSVGNEVGEEFTKMAIMASIIASLGILVYMAFRFEFWFGFAAVVALFHDLIITFGLFNLLGTFGYAGDVSLDVMSALLVVLGYSVNDTIVIFDRIRENMKLHPGRPMREQINRSISESLNRTMMTAFPTIVALIIMLVVGGTGLYDFALVLVIGIIKGTYSSSFIAAPVLHDVWERRERKSRQGGRKVVQPLMKDRA